MTDHQLLFIYTIFQEGDIFSSVASLPYDPLYNEIIHTTCKQTVIYRYDIPKTSSTISTEKTGEVVHQPAMGKPYYESL